MTVARLAWVALLALACGEPVAALHESTTGFGEASSTTATGALPEDHDPGPPPSCDVAGQGGRLAWSHAQEALPGKITALATTPDGAVVIVGTVQDHHTDAYVQVRDPTGALVWSDLYAGVHDLDDAPLGVTVDDEGFIHILATETISEIVTGDYPDIVDRLIVLRYAPDGAHVWRLERPPVGPDSLTRAYGRIGGFADTTVLLEGTGHGSNTFRYASLTLDRFGNIRTAVPLEIPATTNSRHAIGPDGSYCFAGGTYHDGEDAVWLGCFAADGAELWSRHDAGSDRVDALVIGRAREVYLARYDNRGALLWSFQADFESPEHTAYGSRIVATPQGDAAIIADYLVDHGNYSDWSTWLAYVTD
jgi:outer membrane protein assembly factor BamB